MPAAAPNKMDPHPLGQNNGKTGVGMPAESAQTAQSQPTAQRMHSGNSATPKETMTSGIERSMGALADKMHPRG